MTAFFNPDQQFTDNIQGLALALGTVYFGEPNEDPVTNPKQPFSDSDLTTPVNAVQTLTSAGKLAYRVWLSGPYSLRVVSAQGVQIINEPYIYGDISAPAVTFPSMAAFVSGTIIGDVVIVQSFYGGWPASVGGPLGESEWYFDGTSGGTPTTATTSAIIAAMASGRVIGVDGRGWRLRIKDQRTNPYMFGLIGDSVADDTPPLQAALTFADANRLPWEASGIGDARITSTINIPTSIKANFAGLRILPDASMGGTFAARLTGGAGSTLRNFVRGQISNLWLYGRFVDGHVDETYTVDGLALGGVGDVLVNCGIYDLRIEGFRDGLLQNTANSYINSFFNPVVVSCWRRLLSITASVENLNFHGGNISEAANSSFTGVAVYVGDTASSVDVLFNGTSLDYNDHTFVMATGHMTLSGCHLENNNANPHFALTKTPSIQGCMITLVGGQMAGGPLPTWNGIAAESANGRPAWITTTGGQHSISIQNTNITAFRTTETVTEIVKNISGVNNKVDVKPIMLGGYFSTPASPQSISLSKNSIYVAASGATTGWATSGGGAWSADTIEMYAPDNGSRKFVSAGSSGEIYQQIPLSDATAIVVKAWIKCTVFVAGFATIRVRFYAPDGTTVLQDSTMAQFVAAVGDWVPVWGRIPVPAGAAQVRMSDYGASFNGTAHFSSEYLWLI